MFSVYMRNTEMLCCLHKTMYSVTMLVMLLMYFFFLLETCLIATLD